MSTRCHIIVNENPCMIYKHSDGYPEGVLPTLVPFWRHFMHERGWDPEYLVAQIVREFARVDVLEEPEQKKRLSFDAISWHRTLGWGLGLSLHGDEEFVYIIYKDRIEVRTPTWDFKTTNPTPEQTQLEQMVPLDEG